MSDPLSTELDNPVVLVERVCDQFEAALRAGGRPRIEQFLATLPECAVSMALRELLLLELDYRHGQGETPAPEDYRERFAGHGDVVTPAFEEFRATPRPAASPPSAAPPQVGAVVGGCELLEVIGRGGMGVVYRARQPHLGRAVAVKMIRTNGPLSDEELQRFRTEAEALAALQHPNVVQIHESDDHGGLPYLVLEYVAGPSLDRVLKGTPRPPREAARLVEILAAAIAAAHRRGVIHRDLKPGNILLAPAPQPEAPPAPAAPPPAPSIRFDTLDPRESATAIPQVWPAVPTVAEPSPAAHDGGDLLVPKITDFGLAKRLGELGPAQTHSGAVLGTPSYMAPEQARGATREIGPAVDVWALGAILYECLTGRPPFRGVGTLQTLALVCDAEPVPPRRLQPGVPRDLENITLKCLQKEPARRYAAAQDLAEDLGRFLRGEPVAARPVGALARAWKWARRRPAAAALIVAAAVAVLALAGGAAGWAYYAQQKSYTEEIESINTRLESSNRTVGKLNVSLQGALGKLAEQERHGRRLRYVAEISWAQQLWDARLAENLPRVEEILRGLRPGPGEEDLRSFDWRYLDAMTRGPRAPLAGDGRPVECLAFSPDGRFLAAGTRGGRLQDGGNDPGGTVYLWSAASGELLHTFPAGPGVVPAVAFSRAGDLLFAAREGLAVSAWNCTTGTPRFTQKALHGAGGIVALALTPDGKQLATLAGDRTLCLWAVGPGRLDAAGPPLHLAARGQAFALAPRGERLLAIGNGNGTLSLYQLGAGKSVNLPAHQRGVSSVAFDPSGTALATASQDGQVKIWDVPALDRARVRLDLAAGGKARAVAYHPDGMVLACARSDGVVRVWEAATGRHLADLATGGKPLTCLAFAPDGTRLAAGGESGEVRLWAAAQWRGQRAFTPPGQAFAIAFTPDGALAVGGLDGSLRLYPVVRGKPPREFPPGPPEGFLSVAVSPDGATLVAGTAAGDLWRYATGPEGKGGAWIKEAHPGAIRGLAFAPNGAALASAGGDGTVCLWDLKTAERTVVGTHTGGAEAVAFTPDGAALASAGQDRAVRVWDVTERKLLREFAPGWPVAAIAFDPSGQELAAGLLVRAGGGRPSGRVARWAWRNGDELPTLPAPLGGVWSLGFTPDGLVLAAASEDGAVTLWDRATGLERAIYRTGIGLGLRLALSHDGTTLAVRDAQHVIRFWHAPRR